MREIIHLINVNNEHYHLFIYIIAYLCWSYLNMDKGGTTLNINSNLYVFMIISLERHPGLTPYFVGKVTIIQTKNVLKLILIHAFIGKF